jgi:sucrose phosphorylase
MGLMQGSIPSITLEVDCRLGDWESVRALGEHLELVADPIVNHMSSDFPQFRISLNGGL